MVQEVDVRFELARKLQEDEEYRKQFFRIQAQKDVAEQLIKLRALRNMTQIQVANLASMKQSSISRIEQAEYGSWNYKTLVRVTEPLGARVKIIIEPVENVIAQYKEDEESLIETQVNHAVHNKDIKDIQVDELPTIVDDSSPMPAEQFQSQSCQPYPPQLVIPNAVPSFA